MDVAPGLVAIDCCLFKVQIAIASQLGSPVGAILCEFHDFICIRHLVERIPNHVPVMFPRYLRVFGSGCIPEVESEERGSIVKRPRPYRLLLYQALVPICMSLTRAGRHV